jgi:hypothetical protein
MLTRSFFVAILCLAVLLCGARPHIGHATAVRDATRVPVDSSAVIVRQVPSEKLEEFRRDPDFRYDRRNGTVLSVWDWIEAWFRNTFGDVFRYVNDAAVRDALKYTIYAIVIITLVFVIIKLIGADLRGVFFSPKKRITTDASIEDIEHVDFEALIAEFLARRDYRTVVRLLYHKALKELSARNLIRWKIDKTNRDYCSELAGSLLSSEFTELTRIFEYIWYGNFDCAADSFSMVRDLYEGFYKMLADEKK